MEWFSGNIAECIRKVKTEQKLFLVFSRGEDDVSQQISEVLDTNEITSLCKDAICLKIQSGSITYTQFAAFYPVPSIPCIHLISPFGGVLSVKAADFSQEQISQWLEENREKFKKEKEVKTMEEKAQNQPPLEEKSVDKSEGRTMEEKAQNQQPLEESFARKSDSKPLNQEATPIGDSVSNLTHSEAKTSSDSSEAQNSSPPSASVQENASEEAPHSGLSLEEKVEHARKLLEEKQKAKAVEEFQKAHEEELKRRELGRNLTEFKRMQRERELRERIEEQKREKAEREAHRRQVLAQIEADRRERIATSTPKPKGPEGSSSDTKSAAFNPDEVRLQIRLPDGAHMVGVFSAEAHLGDEVRDFIAARVQGRETTAYNGASVPPLSEAMRSSFAPVVSAGYSFRQTRPPPPRTFTPEEETSKTLRDLGLWPSSILILHRTSSSYSLPSGAVAEYSQSVASYVFSLLWSGVRAAGGAVYYLGDSLVSAGQSVWQTLFGAGGGQTVGRGDSGGRPESRPGASDDDESKEGRAYRRQGKISRLSHMPDDSDEQARWNGNSTTQL